MKLQNKMKAGRNVEYSSEEETESTVLKVRISFGPIFSFYFIISVHFSVDLLLLKSDIILNFTNQDFIGLVPT